MFETLPKCRIYPSDLVTLEFYLITNTYFVTKLN